MSTDLPQNVSRLRVVHTQDRGYLHIMVQQIRRLFGMGEAPVPPAPLRGRVDVVSTIVVPGGKSFKVVRKDILDAAFAKSRKVA